MWYDQLGDYVIGWRDAYRFLVSTRDSVGTLLHLQIEACTLQQRGVGDRQSHDRDLHRFTWRSSYPSRFPDDKSDIWRIFSCLAVDNDCLTGAPGTRHSFPKVTKKVELQLEYHRSSEMTRLHSLYPIKMTLGVEWTISDSIWHTTYSWFSIFDVDRAIQYGQHEHDGTPLIIFEKFSPSHQLWGISF